MSADLPEAHADPMAMAHVSRLSAHNARQAREARLRRDALAELVAEGKSIADAGAIIGTTPAVAFKMWRRIRTELGPQAC